MNNFQVWSGGCRSHARGSGWRDYCLDGVDFNTAGAALRVEGNGFRFLKTGYYRVNAWADQHGQGGGYNMQFTRNGASIFYTHNRKWDESGWYRIIGDLTYKFNANDHFKVRLHASSDRSSTYIWHSWNSSGSHSRVQVSYEAESAKDAAHCGCKNCATNRYGQRCEITPCQGKTRANHCNNRGNPIVVGNNCHCHQCNGGYYGTYCQTACAAGRFSPLHAGSCQACGNDYKYSGSASSACSTCAKGSRTHGNDSNTRSNCSPCTGGYTCQGNSHQAPCPVGTGTPAGRSTCADCTAGKYQKQVAQAACKARVHATRKADGNAQVQVVSPRLAGSGHKQPRANRHILYHFPYSS